MLALLTSTWSEPPRKGMLAYSVSALARAGAATAAAARPERRSRRETPSACICMHEAALVERSDGIAAGAKAAAEPRRARRADLRMIVLVLTIKTRQLWKEISSKKNFLKKRSSGGN